MSVGSRACAGAGVRDGSAVAIPPRAVFPLPPLLLVLATTAAAPSFLVPAEPQDPDGGASCSARDALALALEERFPTLSVSRASAALDEGALAVDLSGADGGATLVVTTRSGERVLERELSHGSCEEAAVAAATVLEFRLRELAWPGFEPAPVTLPAPPLLEPPPLPPPPSPWSGTVQLGPGVAFGSRVQPAALLEAAVRSSGFLEPRLSLGGTLETVAADDILVRGVERGELRSQAFSIRAAAQTCRALFSPRASGCVGPSFGAALLVARATGSLELREGAVLVLPAAGASGRLGWAITPRWEVALSLTALAPLGAGSLGVEGTDARRAFGPTLDAALTAGWKFF